MRKRNYFQTQLSWFTADEHSIVLFRMLNDLFFPDPLPDADIVFGPLDPGTPVRYAVNGEFRPRGIGNGRPAILLDPESIRASCLSSGDSEVFRNLCTCLLHEMVHYKCWSENRREVDRTGQYHTKVYQRVAREHGLECELSPYRPTVDGFNMTTLSEESWRTILDHLEAYKNT